MPHSKPKIVLEVGAWNSEYLQASRTSDTLVYAFEPDPKNFFELKNKAHAVANFRAFNLAVSNFSGKATFYPCRVRGCSSLQRFHSSAKRYWVDQILNKDYLEGEKHCPKETRRFAKLFGKSIDSPLPAIEVSVIDLESFVEFHQIPYISHLHVDAQGEDLKVLFGLGAKLQLVESGVIEVATKHPLYEKQPPIAACIQFLEEHGFEIINEHWNYFDLEKNLSFRKKPRIGSKDRE